MTRALNFYWWVLFYLFKHWGVKYLAQSTLKKSILPMTSTRIIRSFVSCTWNGAVIIILWKLHDVTSIVFSVQLIFIPVLVPQTSRLGVRCSYPVRHARPTAKLATSIGQLGVFPSSGPRVCLVWVVGIRVSLWGAVFSLLHCGVGTNELGFSGVFIVCIYQSVRLDLGYLISHFQIRQSMYLKLLQIVLIIYSIFSQ